VDCARPITAKIPAATVTFIFPAYPMSYPLF
jgi:hypothetical protein